MMATMASEVEERNVSLGRVFSRTFGVMGRNPVAAFGIAFLLYALPHFAVNYVTQSWQRMALTTGASIALFAVTVAGAILAFVLSALVQGALVQATLADCEGRTADFGECLSAGLSRVLPLVGTALIVAICTALGMVLLLVPGFIVITMWMVASPTVVAERAGVFEALGRSRALTAGARWKVFGLLLVIAVVLILVSSAWGFLMVAMIGLPAMTQQNLWFLALNLLLSTVMISFFAIMATSLYVELRNWKEGAPSEALGNIFA